MFLGPEIRNNIKILIFRIFPVVFFPKVDNFKYNINGAIKVAN